MNTKLKQLRRSKLKRRIKDKVLGTEQVPRLLVYKSNQRMYAQLVNDQALKTITSVSSVSVDKDAKSVNIGLASKTGSLIGDKVVSLGFKEVKFDRSGYKYHGKVKALADAVREKGIKF